MYSTILQLLVIGENEAEALLKLKDFHIHQHSAIHFQLCSGIARVGWIHLVTMQLTRAKMFNSAKCIRLCISDMLFCAC